MSRFIQIEKPSKSEGMDISCIDCDHKDSLSDAGFSWLVCASCKSFRGFRVGNFKCTCGSDIFQITQDRLYCPNCGADRLWKP